MKLTHTYAECISHFIINCINSDGHVADEVFQGPPLRCCVVDDELEDAIHKVSDKALRRNFLVACSGESCRWRLFRIQVLWGALTLSFVDLSATGRGRDKQHFVSFNKPVSFLGVTAEQSETGETDLYYIEYYGKGCDKSDREGDNPGNKSKFKVAEIMVGRGGRLLRLERIMRRGLIYYLDIYFVD